MRTSKASELSRPRIDDGASRIHPKVIEVLYDVTGQISSPGSAATKKVTP
jgi:hypothetical protein